MVLRMRIGRRRGIGREEKRREEGEEDNEKRKRTIEYSRDQLAIGTGNQVKERGSLGKGMSW